MVVNLLDVFNTSLLDEFSSIMKDSTESTLLTDKRKWWTTRRNLDKQIKVRMYVCSKCLGTCICVHVYVCTCMCVSVYMYVCVYLCTCMYVCIYVHVCMCVSVYM